MKVVWDPFDNPIKLLSQAPEDTRLTEAQVAMLERARQLIQRGWCKGTLAEDQYGRPIGLFGEEAPARFCLIGSLGRAVQEATSCVFPMNERAHYEALRRALQMAPNNPVIYSLTLFNDRLDSEEEVLRLFDKALAPYRK